MGEWFVGEIRLFTYNQGVPEGWFECSGQQLNVQQYQALFAVIGNTYGGNGTTTFNLPDLRGRTILGVDDRTYLPGRAGGTEAVVLTANNLPAHNHAVKCTSATGAVSNPANAHFAVIAPSTVSGAPAAPQMYAPISGVSPPPTAHLNALTVGSNGSGAGHENRQPSMALVYGIAWQGVFPSRS